jgi:hypothetical protein
MAPLFQFGQIVLFESMVRLGFVYLLWFVRVCISELLLFFVLWLAYSKVVN